jgi:hypothetical protein
MRCYCRIGLTCDVPDVGPPWESRGNRQQPLRLIDLYHQWNRLGLCDLIINLTTSKGLRLIVPLTPLAPCRRGDRAGALLRRMSPELALPGIAEMAAIRLLPVE